MFCIVIKESCGSLCVIGPMEEEQAIEMKAKYYRHLKAEVCHMNPRGLAIECEDQHIERMAGTIAEPDCC